MNKTLWHAALAAEAIVCILLAFLTSTAESASALFVFPLVPLGEALRALSLSGTTGNQIALALFALSGLTPLLMLLPIRRTHRLEDALPCLLCAMVWLSLYAIANPSLLKQWFGELSSAEADARILNSCAICIAVAYVVLRVLRGVHAADSNHLLHTIGMLLRLSMALFVFAAFYPGVQDFLRSARALCDAKAAFAQWLLLILRLPVGLLPYLTDLQIAASALQLTKTLCANDSARAVQTAEQLSRRCTRALSAVTLSNLAFHLLQLLLAPQLSNIHISIDLPLFSMLLTLAALLAARLIRENKRLRDDSALFI